MLRFIAVICCLISSILCDLSIMSIETPTRATFNQNPHWDNKTSSLYFVDSFGNLLYRYSYKYNKLHWVTVEDIVNPGFFMPIRGSSHKFAVGSNASVYLIDWDGFSRSATIDQKVFSVQKYSFLNSATVSSRGEFYVGNYGLNQCAERPTYEQYGFKKNNELVVFAAQYVSTLGTVLVEAERTFYHLDACRKTITAFDWNPYNGLLSSERLVLVLDQYPDWIHPIGLAADKHGFLYSGLYNGSAVIKIDPRIPAVVGEITLPTPLIGSPAFGGPENDILFVPSSRTPIDLVTNELGDAIDTPPAGDLFIIRGLNTQGVPSYRPYL